VTLLRQGAGLGDPQRALPNPNILLAAKVSVRSAAHSSCEGSSRGTGEAWHHGGTDKALDDRDTGPEQAAENMQNGACRLQLPAGNRRETRGQPKDTERQARGAQQLSRYS